MENKTKILIVDDDLALASTIKMVLDKEGYLVDVTGNGSGALDLMKKNTYDIVLVDYNLPDINGLDFIKQMKLISNKTVPIIISGTRSMDLAFQGMRLGAFDYLVKPLDYEELKKAIKSIMGKNKKYEQEKADSQQPAADEPDPAIQQPEVPEEKKEIPPVQIKPPQEVKKIPSIPAGPPDKTEEPGSVQTKPPPETQEIPAVQTEPPEDEKDTSIPPVPDKAIDQSAQEAEKDKTVFDFILDRSSMIQKNIRSISIFIVVLIVLFITLDTIILRSTRLGRKLYSKIWPPAIILDSRPTGALVSLTDMNGLEILKGENNTPVAIRKIDPGSYILKMNLGAYNPIERKITVFSEKKNVMDITVTGETQEFSDKKTQKFIIPMELMVTIVSEPSEAEVYIDNIKMGNETPMTVDLSAGMHTIILIKEGFDALGDSEKHGTYGQCILDLTKQEQEDMDKRYWDIRPLEKGIHLKGTFWKEVRIISEPSGAQFLINGELRGQTPANTRLAVGEHVLKIRKAGFLDWKKTIYVPESKEILARLYKTVKFIAYDADNPGEDLGAEVWVNRNKIIGKTTPFHRSFEPAESCRITFTKNPDFEPWTKNIKVSVQDNIIANMQRKIMPVKIKVIEADREQPVDSATVIIDGKTKGKTDVNGSWQGGIKSGERLIEIRKEKLILTMPFLYKKTIRKNITAGGGEIRIYLDIEDGVPVGEKIIEPPVEESRPLLEPQVQENEGQTSVLIIDTRPNFPMADIIFDGKPIGDTIRKIPDVSLGMHEVTIRHPYIGKISSKIKIDKPGQKMIITFDYAGKAEVKE